MQNTRVRVRAVLPSRDLLLLRDHLSLSLSFPTRYPFFFRLSYPGEEAPATDHPSRTLMDGDSRTREDEFPRMRIRRKDGCARRKLPLGSGINFRPNSLPPARSSSCLAPSCGLPPSCGNASPGGAFTSLRCKNDCLTPRRRYEINVDRRRRSPCVFDA